jgi:hypothetical protein
MVEMRDSLRETAEAAMALVVEAECPLCRVELQIHDERALLRRRAFSAPAVRNPAAWL